MAAHRTPVRFVLNEREIELLRKHLSKASSKADFTITEKSTTSPNDSLPERDDHNAAAFRSATRVFLLTLGSLRGADALLGYLSPRQSQTATRSRKPLVASKFKLALSFSSLLYLHSMLYRILSRLRLRLLHEKVRNIRERYPKIYAALTSRIAPAVGAGLSGLALGICPADQLRVSLVIYVVCRALEVAYAAIEHTDLVRNKPSWLGSWLLFALSQGQLLHALVFDRDCFPRAYGDFILGYSPEYIQRRPPNMSPKVVWPSSDDIIDGLAQMARLKWPPFESPILNPNKVSTLPSSIDPTISPITSRAHPAISKLSCALIHPSDPSCFMAYLRQNLLAFPQLARFYAMYYGAFSLLRIKKMIRDPITSLNRLSESVLRSTLAISGSIGVAWGSICLFQVLLPRVVLPKFRFFVGGFLGGMFQLFDRTPAGHMTSLYAARTSVDSLWKVGVKHRWWKGIRGGDVWLFVAVLGLINVVYDLGKDTPAGKDSTMTLIKLLRGEIEVGIPKKKQQVEDVKSEEVQTEDKTL
ncbi:hypothetical protein PV08_00081 [Exophiala spinifera]|uniref:Transmembrane protein 135 N-terminal domain-containing protein n=1 Tax=Exophiala spinifera TaxID=91928 RepID=A0A0D2C7L1_9EURO|nr:uncharacterized protein PV08_00081 [Exophiala spinifera]KIW19509.1 hypothetical protein PV08_00081 [Exophiala spinifera]